jgi:type VI secretion system protein ImpC
VSARVRWLVAGAFHPTPTGRRFVLDAASFTRELALATRGLSVSVRDRLGAGDTSTYALQLDDLDAFDLAEVVRSQPDLRSLGALRDSLAGTRPLAAEDAERLRASVGTGRLAEALHQVRRASPDARRAALGLIDEALLGTAKDLLQHPRVARLESLWRGLHWVWSHCPEGAGMELEVLDVAPDALEDALAEHLDASPLHCPDACFLPDVELGIDELSRLAALAEAVSVPLVVTAPAALRAEGPRLAGEQDYRPPEDWRRPRADEASRWLFAALNPVVMKAERQGPVARECLTSPVFAVGALLAASFRDTHTFARMVGAGSTLRAPGVWRPAGGAAVATERHLSLREQQRLAALGLLGVSGWPDSDAVQLLSAPSVYGGPDTAPLPAQLLTGRIARLLQEVAGRLPAGATPAEISAVCARAAAAFLPTGAAGGCELLGQDVALGGGERGLRVRASLRPELAGTALRLELTVPRPRGGGM